MENEETPVTDETEPETPVTDETEPETPVTDETEPETPVADETALETSVVTDDTATIEYYEDILEQLEILNANMVEGFWIVAISIIVGVAMKVFMDNILKW